MASFEYTAKDQSGGVFSGNYDGVSSVAVLRNELAKMGYILLKAKRSRRRALGKPKKIKRTEVVAFAYKFAGMYSAGLPIISCIETLEMQTDSLAFKDVLTDIKHDIQKGLDLAGSFRKYKNIFSDFFLGMVEAGQSSGKLAEALELSAEYLEKQADLKRKVRSAFAYPIVVSITCLFVITMLLIFVIPVFSKMYDQLKVSLPGPTQVLVALSITVRNWWWAILFLIVSMVLLFRKILENPQVRAWWDTFKLKMPVFSRLNRMIVISKFIKTFGMLISVGVPIVKALQVSSLVANNCKMTEISDKLQTSIEVGVPFAESLSYHDIFPPLVVQLAASGEQAGVLPDMLSKGVHFLDKDIERTLQSILVKLEPTLTVIMGLIVGLLLLGIYLPMYDYMNHFK